MRPWWCLVFAGPVLVIAALAAPATGPRTFRAELLAMLDPAWPGLEAVRDALRAGALERLTAELDIQVYPGGAQIELAPAYHGASLHNFLGPIELAPRTGFEVPVTYTAKLERMYDYRLASMQPTRRMPPFNDSSEGDVIRTSRPPCGDFPGAATFDGSSPMGERAKCPLRPFAISRSLGRCFSVADGTATRYGSASTPARTTTDISTRTS